MYFLMWEILTLRQRLGSKIVRCLITKVFLYIILAGAEDGCTFTLDISQSLSASGVQTYEVSCKKSLSVCDFGGSRGWVYFCVGNFSLFVSV